MKCKALLLFLILIIPLFLSILPVSADIYYNANTYVFTFPTYGTAMAFDTDMTFSSAYRVSEYWYFATTSVSLIGFQVQVASLLVTDFFVANASKLEFQVTASGTSTTKIYVGNRGSPSDVVGETGWNYNLGILTIYVVHSSPVTVTVTWGAGDTTPPTISNVAHNTTVESQPCKFSAKWTDDTALGDYIFSYNGTGAWANDTMTSFTTNPDWANVTKTLPAASTIVGYRWYARDNSSNWATSSIYTLTTTAVGEDIVVLLGTPSDGTTNYAKAQIFTYTPVFASAIQNASIWINASGTWQAVAYNTTTVTNNTLNSLTYTFTTSGTYIWNIGVFNTTTQIFAESNRTLTMTLEPRCSSISHSNTDEGETSIFTSIWADGDALSYYIFSWNSSGSWVNSSQTAIPGSPTTYVVTQSQTLPGTVGVKISYRFYVRDSDNNWAASNIGTLTTTESFDVGITDPLFTYLTDLNLLGFVFACYTSRIGMAFYAIILLMVSIGFYNRTKSVPFISIMWLVLGGSFLAVTWIFSPIAVLLVAFGLAGIIYSLFEKEQS